jgi:hypothetical protein
MPISWTSLVVRASGFVRALGRGAGAGGVRKIHDWTGSGSIVEFRAWVKVPITVAMGIEPMLWSRSRGRPRPRLIRPLHFRSAKLPKGQVAKVHRTVISGTAPTVAKRNGAVPLFLCAVGGRGGRKRWGGAGLLNKGPRRPWGCGG